MTNLNEVEIRIKKELVLLHEEWDRRDMSNYSNNDAIIKKIMGKKEVLKAIKLVKEFLNE